MRRATSVDALGEGRFDGEAVEIAFGDTIEKLRWHASAGAYVGRPRQTIEYRHLDRTNTTGPMGTWMYLSHASPDASLKAYSWFPEAVLDADDAYNAGLSLQEKIDAVWWSWTAGSVFQVAVVWYGFEIGGYIDPAIVPTDGVNIGAKIDSWATVRGVRTTGWIAGRPATRPEARSWRRSAPGIAGSESPLESVAGM
jgi:hypothetical protein